MRKISLFACSSSRSVDFPIFFSCLFVYIFPLFSVYLLELRLVCFYFSLFVFTASINSYTPTMYKLYFKRSLYLHLWISVPVFLLYLADLSLSPDYTARRDNSRIPRPSSAATLLGGTPLNHSALPALLLPHSHSLRAFPFLFWFHPKRCSFPFCYSFTFFRVWSTLQTVAALPEMRCSLLYYCSMVSCQQVSKVGRLDGAISIYVLFQYFGCCL